MFDSLIFNLQEHAPALATLVLILLFGTSAQIAADRLRLPSTGPLLIAGLLFGPARRGEESDERRRQLKRAINSPTRLAACGGHKEEK